MKLLSLEDGERIFGPNRVGVDILKMPRLVTRPGVEAKVEIVGEFVYPTNYDPETIPLKPTEFATENTGVTGNITTWATSKPRVVRIDFVGRVCEFEGFQFSTKFPGAEEPVFKIREAGYKGRFENGSYVILGNREDVQQVHTRTPVLGSIPVVERLFRGNYEQRIFRLVAAQVLVKGFDAKGGL